MERKGVPLRCRKCGHEWTYRGRSTYYASCPSCHTLVKLEGSAAAEIEASRVVEEFRAGLDALLTLLSTDEGKEEMAEMEEAYGTEAARSIRHLAMLLSGRKAHSSFYEYFFFCAPDSQIDALKKVLSDLEGREGERDKY